MDFRPKATGVRAAGWSQVLLSGKNSELNFVNQTTKIFNNNKVMIYFQPCKTLYVFGQKGQLEQHSKTKLHVESVHRFKQRPERQLLLLEATGRSNSFFADLCKAFVAANIPFSKLDKPEFHNFLEKYTTHNIPSRVTLTNNYLPKVYAEVSIELL